MLPIRVVARSVRPPSIDRPCLGDADGRGRSDFGLQLSQVLDGSTAVRSGRTITRRPMVLITPASRSGCQTSRGSAVRDATASAETPGQRTRAEFVRSRRTGRDRGGQEVPGSNPGSPTGETPGQRAGAKAPALTASGGIASLLRRPVRDDAADEQVRSGVVDRGCPRVRNAHQSVHSRRPAGLATAPHRATVRAPLTGDVDEVR